jgi:serine/threonine-protein kinase RsbT
MAFVLSSSTIELRAEQDIVRARQAVRKLAQETGMSLVDQTKLVTAASELARNTVTHGQGGHMRMERLEEGGRRGVRLCFQDQGPGITDLDLAMTDGWTSGGGLGLGLTGSKRLCNEFDLHSVPGQGTRVTIARWV